MVVLRLFVLVMLIAVAFAGCGAEQFTAPVLGPAPLDEVTSLVDDVAVRFRVEQVRQFQSQEFIFHGTVENLGPDRPNARFEVYSIPSYPNNLGGQPERILARQDFDILTAGSHHGFTVTVVLNNGEGSQVFGRFAHD